jgi:hypothetical protein
MARTGRPNGRPSEYKADTHVSAVLSAECIDGGATWTTIAKVCGKSIPTVKSWSKEHEGFLAAIKLAKALVDDSVEVAFKSNATGGAVKSTTRDQYGRITTTYYPPDTTAGIFWLCNRRRKGYDPDDPDAGWQHVQRLEHTGADGGPIQHADVTEAPLEDLIAEATALCKRAAAVGSTERGDSPEAG